MIELLAPRRGERILLLGWGDGAEAERVLALADTVVGIDTGIERVAAARRRGLDARVGDAHHLSFDAEFDAVLSSTLRWVKRADAVLAGVWRALRPGGRFVAAACAGQRLSTCIAALEGALRRRGVDPATVLPRSFHFPTGASCRAQLTAHGFHVDLLSTIADVDPTTWLAAVGERALAALEVGERPDFLAEVEAQVRHAGTDGDTVRLRFVARRPSRARPCGAPHGALHTGGSAERRTRVVTG